MKKYIILLLTILSITSCSSNDTSKKEQFIEVGSGVYKKVEELKTIGDTGNLTIEELKKLDKAGIKNENLTKLKDLCKEIGINDCLYINGNPRYYFEYNKGDYGSFNPYSRQDPKINGNLYMMSIELELKKIKTKEEYISYINNFWKPEYGKLISNFLDKYTTPKKSPNEMNFVFSYFIDEFYNGYGLYGLDELSDIDNYWFRSTVCTRGYNLGMKLKDLPGIYKNNCSSVYKDLLDLEEKNSPEYRKKVEDAINKEIQEIDSRVQQ